MSADLVRLVEGSIPGFLATGLLDPVTRVDDRVPG